MTDDNCCCIDVYVLPHVYKQRVIAARKKHECCECGRDIRIGDLYERTFATYEGDAHIYTTCLICRKIREDYFPCGYHHLGLAEELWECYEVEL